VVLDRTAYFVAQVDGQTALADAGNVTSRTILVIAGRAVSVHEVRATVTHPARSPRQLCDSLALYVRAVTNLARHSSSFRLGFFTADFVDSTALVLLILEDTSLLQALPLHRTVVADTRGGVRTGGISTALARLARISCRNRTFLYLLSFVETSCIILSSLIFKYRAVVGLDTAGGGVSDRFTADVRVVFGHRNYRTLGLLLLRAGCCPGESTVDRNHPIIVGQMQTKDAEQSYTAGNHVARTSTPAKLFQTNSRLFTEVKITPVSLCHGI